MAYCHKQFALSGFVAGEAPSSGPYELVSGRITAACEGWQRSAVTVATSHRGTMKGQQ